MLSTVTAFGAISATFNSAYDVGTSANGYTASGALTLTLNFSPAPGQQLLLVNNTAATAISGTFTGLAEGATRTATYGGNTFTFRISYVGGTGNDITLTRVAGTGQVTSSNTYLWSLLAGSPGGSGSFDTTGPQASFDTPSGVAVDSAGNLYVTDSNNHTIRKITSAGTVSTLAGGAGISGVADGTGSAARFSSPRGIAVNSAGDIYVADTGNQTIRKVTPAGVVTTLAGAARLTGSIDGTSSAARFNSPFGVTVDSSGNVYVADTNNHTIRKITSTGVVTTLAGTVGSSGSVDGAGSAARFKNPYGVTVDSSGSVYVSDSGNNTIRRVTSAGVVTTLAGTAGLTGSANGTGSAARFFNPLNVAVDSAGNVYVGDTGNHTIRKVTSSGVVTTLAGTAGSIGSIDGAGSAARFYSPWGVAVDSAGNVAVADRDNNTIRKVTTAGIVSTFAGTAGSSLRNIGNTDGTGSAARFSSPYGLTVDAAGNVYAADYGNHTIRKVTPAGVVTTLAGTAGLTGSTNGTGSAARFSSPSSVAVDSAGNVYVADYANQVIRKVTPAGVVTTLSGSAGLSGSTDGTGSAARFKNPSGVAVDSSGNIYVADSGNHTIRKVTSSGVVATVAGTAGSIGSIDGTGSAARFDGPTGVAVDSAGNVYVADRDNNTIRKVNPAGVVTTLAGSWGNGSNDGTGSAARFSGPSGLAVDSTGNVYVADQGNHTIRKVSPAGVVTTLAGSTGVIGYNTGYVSARFNYPRAVVVSSSGRMYVANSSFHQIAQAELVGFQPVLTQTNVSGLGVSGATLNGTVNPNGFVTTGAFEYGLTPAYGSSTSLTLSPSTGTTAQLVSAGLTGLSSETLYYYRLTATNVDGTAYASGGTFKTLSTNANLTGLSLSSGTLSPTFVSATTNYVVSVANSTTSIFLTPTCAQADASLAVRVNSEPYAAVASGTTSGSLTLNVGSNTVDVRVTAQDGVTQKTYSMTVSRLAAVLNPVFNEGSDVTVVSAGFVPTGSSLGALTLGFSPIPMQELILVNNTGAGSIDGIFTGLAEGSMLTASYGGNVFTFRISYAGGDGNDITLSRAGGVGQIANTNTYLWSHLAGRKGGQGSLDAAGAEASFNSPGGVAVDSAGNVYVADSNNHTIRKVTLAGVVTTLAGSAGLIGSTDGTGSAARFNKPADVAVDSSGNVYVADYANQVIRKVTPAGVVTTLVGSAGLSGSTDGTGSAARFKNPSGVAVDSSGNVYVADQGNHTIRKVTLAGVVTTLAGSAGLYDSTDGTGSNARFTSPSGVAVDSAGNVYVADTSNHTIRKVSPTGVVTTLAGSAGLFGGADGTGSAARFYYPEGVVVDSTGNLLVADYNNHTIRKVSPAGIVTTFAGTALTSGSTDGTGGAARFRKPTGVAVDNSGNVYVADSGNHTIRQVTSAAVVATLAGTADGADGTGSAASFYLVDASIARHGGIGADSAGNAYVADTANHTIRKVTPSGVVTTLAGASGSSGSVDGTGSAARFDRPSGVATDGTGNVYVADNGNGYIRKLTSDGTVTTLAGKVSGTGNFSNPSGIAVDRSGSVYVADTYSHTIRKVTLTGVVTNMAGADGISGSADGTGSTARFYLPSGLAVDRSGNVYVSDGNHTIRKVTPAGVVTTLAGSAGLPGSTDGSGAAARFSSPRHVAVDGSGNVYVADYGNHTIRKVSPAGAVTTIGGLAGMIGQDGGIGSAARFRSPLGVAVSTNGRLYATDGNHRVIQGVQAEFQPILTLGSDTGLTVGGVTLNGTVNPNGFVTTAAFEYGVTQAYGSSFSVTLGSSNGTTAQNVSAVLTGLSPGVDYYYRLTATNVDGTTYTAGGTFNTTLSSNADLSDLTLSHGAIEPGVSSGVTSFLASVANATSSITITPTCAEAYATLAVRVNSGTYVAAASGIPTGALPLEVGSNTIDVRVTAHDGATRKNYSIAVTRLESILNPSFNRVGDEPLNSAGFVATGSSLGSLNLSFAPSPIQEILLVNNTGAGAISGTFTGLAEGSTLATGYAGDVFTFRISYLGGDGNDITLTRTGGAGQVTSSNSYQWSLLAGSAGGSGYLDAMGAQASFRNPSSTAVDSSGNVYVADYNNHTIRKVTPTGVVTTLAGSAGLAGSADGTGSNARFNYPNGVAVDSTGNVYVADFRNQTIRKVTPAGVVTTLAGSAGNTGSTDGTGSAARFNDPFGVAVDSTGNVYVADRSNHTIRKVSPAGVVTTFAGTALTSGSTDGTGSAARFKNPSGVAVDSSGNVYVADTWNHSIRKVTPGGVVTTLAGSAVSRGSADGTGSAARFSAPTGVAVDDGGSVYVADSDNNTIRKVTQAGVVTTLAGSSGLSGSTNGTGSYASFFYPSGLAVDSAGNVYVADYNNHTIRKVTPAGVVTSLVGTATSRGSTDGTGSAARFNYPKGVAVDSTGNVYVTDSDSQTIRKVNPAGVVTTLAGTASTSGSTDGTGIAARFRVPAGVAVDRTGNVYVADRSNHTIRKVTPAGVVTTLAGSAGFTGSTNGTGSVARFNYPDGVAVDSAGNVYVADSNNHTIRKVTPGGVVTTLAGSAGLTGSTNGTGIAARFNYPDGVAVDSAGNVYVADSYNYTIRKVTPAGVVSTLAGSAGLSGSTDGTGSAARFSEPTGVAVDDGGSVYVADAYNHTIRKVTPVGVVTTIGGLIQRPGRDVGYGSAALFDYPSGIEVAANGRVYVTDSNHRVVQGFEAGFQPILTQGNDIGITVRGVTLNGTVNPNGLVTTASFEYGLTLAYGDRSNVTLNPSNGTTAQDVSAELTGLSPGVLYYYRLTATNVDGTASTSSGTFVAPSNNADLGGLFLSNGTLHPDFVNATTDYAARVPGNVASISVTPSCAQANATLAMRVNGGTYAPAISGSSSGDLALNDGSNVIDFLVTAQDGVTQKIYSVAVTRLTSVWNPGFKTSNDVFLTTTGFVATGTSIESLSLSFAPTPMQELLLVNNTGSGAISGTFASLAEGAILTAAYGGDSFALRISYVGGDGNDITLTRVGGAGQVTSSSSYRWSHLAGSKGGTGSYDAVGALASFWYPSSTAVDSSGNVYVADYFNHTIRKVTPTGVVTTLAGSAGNTGSTDGTGSAARFNHPNGVAVDSIGNVYVADFNYTIRKVSPAGVVTTLAGSSYGSTDGTGSAARFSVPSGLAVDSSGNVYVADSNNHTIRKVTPAGVVTTLAGSAGLAGSTNGTGSAARFYNPSGVAVDSVGNVYVADASNGTLRKVSPAGVVTTLAGSAGLSGSTNGTGSNARFNGPSDVAVDSAGNVYVADSVDHTIRKVTPTGVVTTLAGSAGLIGSTDGTGSAARFGNPNGVAVDSTGNVYVADRSNHTIRKVTQGGVVTTVAGTAVSRGGADGTGSAAQFLQPRGVGVDISGKVYVADQHAIRVVTSEGVVITLAGKVDTYGGSTDGTGSAARFDGPTGVAVDSSGNVYTADYFNHTIRKVTPTGVVTTLAGSAGNTGSTDGTGSTARFYNPSGVAVDSSGNVYVADQRNHTIRKVTPGGVVTTLAGSAGLTGSSDGTGSAARFYDPNGVAVDSSGNVYVTDYSNHTIRKVTPAGVVTTIAGTAGNMGSTDSTGSAARFSGPSRLAVDSSGNIYVADVGNHTIRKVTSAGVVTTIGGLAGKFGWISGNGSAARFNGVVDVAVDNSGKVYVADWNNRVVQGELAGFQPILTLGSVTGQDGGGVTLNGAVNPNGFVTTAAFEYGTTQSYGSSANVTLTSATGTTAQNVTAGLTGLSAGITYYYRLTATNVDGTSSTEGGTFTTRTSTNADLSGLTLSSGSLNPDFASATTAYTASVASTTTSTAVTPTLAQADATISVRINGGTYAPVTSGSSSGQLPLAIGSNTIEVRVTAQDGVTQKIYTVTLTVNPATGGEGSIASWRQQHFGSDQNSGNAADLATPDGDGIPNLVKYALLMTPGQNSTTRLPQAEITGPPESRRLTLTFQRDPSRSDVAIVVEAQSGLDDAWSEIARCSNGADFTGAAAVSESAGANGSKTVTVQDVQLNGSLRFMRVRVVR
jgi:hypothetical protein